MRLILFGLALVCLLCPLGGSAVERPNILWICAEDLSPVYGCYGFENANTPNIDAFASESLLFKEAYTIAPICAPSRSSLATGLHSASLGTQHLRSEVEIPEEVTPLAALLKQAGYWTAIRGKTDYNFSPDGLFDYWKEDTTPWRNCPEGKPFFAFVNLGSTHEGSGNFAERAEKATQALTSRRDPATVDLPPYYPDTPEMCRLWARYHDLASAFDIEFGKVIDALEEDGLLENTVVFLFSDHGHGLPRYKRWLYLTGLQVPLIVRVPGGASEVVHKPVSLIDLPATALELAGVPRPAFYRGQPLSLEPERERIGGTFPIFAARDRADDMYDLSRLIYDGEYVYIRHFQPHLPPIQEGYIFGDQKDSLRELRRVHESGGDNGESAKLWKPRPVEELFHIPSDPHELTNLADNPGHQERKEKLAARLKRHLLETRDTGFLWEPEMHRRAVESGVTPYEMAQSDDLYPVEKIIEVAWEAPVSDQSDHLSADDPAIRFWAIQSAIMRGDQTIEKVKALLKDESPHVAIAAAELVARSGDDESAAEVFKTYLEAEEPRLALYNARALATSLEKPGLMEEEIRVALKKLENPDRSARLAYRDFTYAAFTSWALEWALVKAGLDSFENLQRRE